MTDPWSPSFQDAQNWGRRVHVLLEDYLALQNGLFKFSFKKAFGLVRPDPAAAAVACGPLLAQVEGLLEQVPESQLDPKDPLGAFFLTFRTYLQRLAEAMKFFLSLCETMERARTEKDRAYWKGPFRQDLLEHQRKERAYLEIGMALNQRWQALKASRPGQAL